MRFKSRGRVILLLICLAVIATGCRVRTTGGGTEDGSGSAGGTAQGTLSGTGYAGAEQDAGDRNEENAESGERTRENPGASRKEFDEDAPAEILPGTERLAEDEGEGGGRARGSAEAQQSAVQLNDDAEDPAVQTVPADEAEETGVSEDGKEADSALTYYSVLLRERTESLFECQRLNVYWETSADHMTVHKSSPEHVLILNAGAYDVSARLLEKNLRVDDGWVGRKNPDVIVKAVDGSVLGTGVHSASSAQKVYSGLLSREGWRAISAVREERVLLLSEEVMQTPYLQLFAELAVARTAYPDRMADVDLDEALKALVQEATGSEPGGILYYGGK